MYEFKLQCLVCGKEKKHQTQSTIIIVKNLIKETGWAKANIKTPSGKFVSSWICDECQKKLGVEKHADDQVSKDE